jgi:hypothetical protein
MRWTEGDIVAVGVFSGICVYIGWIVVKICVVLL